GSPEEVLRGLLLARLLETIDERSLRVHSAEHMPDGAILAGSVERLEHNQKRLAAVGVEEVLQLVHALDMFLDLGQSLLMRLVLSCVGSIDFRPHDVLRAGLDQKVFAIVHLSAPVTLVTLPHASAASGT